LNNAFIRAGNFAALNHFHDAAHKRHEILNAQQSLEPKCAPRRFAERLQMEGG
jgi:hypothetical protein